MKNIMSVDLEDYYCDLPFKEWENYDERVIHNTEIILKLFEKYDVSATFFTVGYIAEKHPELIQKIVSQGHEIASHSFFHTDLRTINKNEFEKELLRSINSLERISGERIHGFRAPFFSINKNNLWVFEIMKKYLKYDSSIFPVKTPLYGIPDALRYSYLISEENPLIENSIGDFYEIPPATLKIPIMGNIPIAGGFYLRFLPTTLIKFGIKKLNKRGHSTMFYLHPKDLDSKMPRISNYSWHYYWGLNNAKNKFEHILKSFKFSSVRDIILNS
jgi:polysaccharide deacetylase family protein (PEP-CTERM system associated)